MPTLFILYKTSVLETETSVFAIEAIGINIPEAKVAVPSFVFENSQSIIIGRIPGSLDDLLSQKVLCTVIFAER